MSYLLGGLMAGVGEGMQQQVLAAREAAMEELRHRRRQEERLQDREWQVEDRDIALAARRSGGGGPAQADGGPPQLSISDRIRVEQAAEEAARREMGLSPVVSIPRDRMGEFHDLFGEHVARLSGVSTAPQAGAGPSRVLTYNPETGTLE